MNYTKQSNPFLIGIFIFFILLDGITRILWLCTSTGVLFGTLLGWILECIFFNFTCSGANNLLYFQNQLAIRQFAVDQRNKNLSALSIKMESLSKISKNNLNLNK